MTEKRFERVYGDIEVVAIDNWKTGLEKCFDDEDYDKFVDELNRLNDENKVAIDWINFLQEKNSELKLRNNRQASTIDNLYSLIEKEDWTALKKIIEEIEEAEELNRLEFEAYCGGDKDD